MKKVEIYEMVLERIFKMTHADIQKYDKERLLSEMYEIGDLVFKTKQTVDFLEYFSDTNK